MLAGAPGNGGSLKLIPADLSELVQTTPPSAAQSPSTGVGAFGALIAFTGDRFAVGDPDNDLVYLYSPGNSTPVAIAAPQAGMGFGSLVVRADKLLIRRTGGLRCGLRRERCGRSVIDDGDCQSNAGCARPFWRVGCVCGGQGLCGFAPGDDTFASGGGAVDVFDDDSETARSTVTPCRERDELRVFAGRVE